MTKSDAQQLIRKVVIVGGGSAGWMTAAALSRMTAAGVAVELVESEEIGIVGVGEATIPAIMDFNMALGIDEHAFVAATQGTFKLGIEFVDWGRLGDRYIHPFGKYGQMTMGVSLHQFWLRQKLYGAGQSDPGPLDHYAIAIAAAHRGRFCKPVSNPEAVLSTLAYAYHFDAGLYARFLRQYAEQRGVKRTEGKIVKVEQDNESGDIAAVVMEDGRRVEGDFFVDCSGFRSLLLGKTLGVPYRSWQHWLPCDSAIAIPCANAGPPIPYTRSSAEQGGWRWRIPLQHRVGNGHVYSSAHTSDEVALDRLMQGLDAPAVGDPRQLRFTAGRRERMWEKNCVAIGLSSGFIEPLESTSIHLIQSGIFRLMSLFPESRMKTIEIEEYNRWMIEEYEHIRDFIILHYHSTARDDSDFWNHCRTMDVPDSLKERIAMWRAAGRVMPRQNALFNEASWVAVLTGQNIMPGSCDPLTAVFPMEQNGRFLEQMRDIIARTAEAMPRHDDYIAKHCPHDRAEAIR
jgi:tryptophan halogenase